MNSSGKSNPQGELGRDFGIADTDLPKGVARWAGGLGSRASAGTTTDKWVRSLVHRHLSSMRRGSLVLQERGDTVNFGADKDAAPTATTGGDIQAVIVVNDPAVYKSIALNGVVGAAEAYMDGYWTSPDLVSVIRFFVSNISELKTMDNERSVPNKIALSLLERITRNSVSKARKNISAHYDLGNDFPELFIFHPSVFWFYPGTCIR